SYKVTFNKAVQLCRARNTTLTTISNREENEFITSKVEEDDDYWIAGLRAIPGSANFAWINGESFRYSNWEQFEPKINGIENCVRFKNGFWYSGDCNKELGFICDTKQVSDKEIGSSVLDKHSKDLNYLRKLIAEHSKFIEEIRKRDERILQMLNNVMDDAIEKTPLDDRPDTESKFHFTSKLKRE
ncbi:pulmonary surfactant-associated protein A-like protein, partial [Leptotrombidium deliense]